MLRRLCVKCIEPNEKDSCGVFCTIYNGCDRTLLYQTFIQYITETECHYFDEIVVTHILHAYFTGNGLRLPQCL